MTDWPCGHERTEANTYSWRLAGKPATDSNPRTRCRQCKVDDHRRRNSPAKQNVRGGNSTKAHAAALEAACQRADARLEDIRWLQDGGLTRTEIASRLGLQEASLILWMRRWGYPW